MRWDLSGVDAELDRLGGVPEHAVALARDFAGSEVSALLRRGTGRVDRAQLELLDRELEQLELADGASGARARRPIFESYDASDESLDNASDESLASIHPVGDHAPEFEAARRQAVAAAHAPSEARASTDEEPDAARERHSDVAPVAAGLAYALGDSEGDDARAADSEPAPEPTLTSAPPEFGDSWPPLGASEPPPAFGADEPPSAVHSVPPPPAPLTESQEIVLPDPIPREELSSESGELLLETDKPSSGSFSLGEETGPIASAPPPATRPRTGLSDFAAADDVGDALEGSQPLSIGNKAGRSRAPAFPFDRDPDAEFDALLSEATNPNGMPADDEHAEMDDLLQGLDDDMHEELATSEFVVNERESDAATDELGLLLEELEDSTEILDRESLDAIQASAPRSEAPARASAAAREEDILADEFDASDLEIVMEEEAQAPTKAPPPPPAPSGTPEKRPSGFLGRFFGRERE